MKKKTHEDWDNFLKLCIHQKSVEELKCLLDLFMTFEERKNMTLRYKIIKALLKDEQTQREMASKLKVSIAKISRGSNSLKMVDEKLKTVLRENLK